MGTRNIADAGDKNVSQLFDGASISRFEASSIERLGIRTLSFTPGVPNQPPVANADSVSTAQNTAVNITVATLLANDSDANSDPLSITGVSNATGGTAVLNDNGTPTNSADDYISFTTSVVQSESPSKIPKTTVESGGTY